MEDPVMGHRRAVVLALPALLLAAGCAAASPSSTPSSPGAPSPAPTAVASPSAKAAASAEQDVAACDAPPGKSSEVHWTLSYRDRTALVHRSERSAGSPAPIVVALHGYGGFGMELERISDLSDAADERGWLVIYPEGAGHPQAWNYDPRGLGHAEDIAFLRAIIDDVVEAGCGDAAHVVVTGISQGGWLADMAGCEMTDVVVGVVSVAGRDFGWPCEPASPVAFAAASGVLDDVLPWEGGPVNAPDPITSVGSVDDWLKARAETRACTGDPAEARQSPHVVVFTWPGCAAPVTLYRVEDGGHSWPSGGGFPPVDHELSVTDVIAGMLDSAP